MVGNRRFGWTFASRAMWVSVSKREKVFGEGGIVQQLQVKIESLAPLVD